LQSAKLDDAEFARLIRVAPLIAIDIILRDPSRRILLAQRIDEPAKNYFFVPGGRIFKNETIKVAFERIASTEVGICLPFEAALLFGVYEHFYSTNRFGDASYGTHYIVLAYEANVAGDTKVKLGGSQSAYEWVAESVVLTEPCVHDYVKAYFKD